MKMKVVSNCFESSSCEDHNLSKQNLNQQQDATPADVIVFKNKQEALFDGHTDKTKQTTLS